MARPKKKELSETAASVMKKPTKRGNPDFVSSSFYVPKKVNFKFDRAILTLKTNGIDVDRSDVLSCLMDRFGVVIDEAEKEGGGEGLDFAKFVGDAAEISGPVTAALSNLKDELRKQRKNEQDLLARLHELSEESELRRAEFEEQTKELLRLALQHIPASERDVFQQMYDLMGEDAEAFNAAKPEESNSSEEIAKLKSTYESVIEQMLKFVPDNEDRRIVEEILSSLKD